MARQENSFLHLPLNGCIIQNRGFFYSQRFPRQCCILRDVCFTFVAFSTMSSCRVQESKITTRR
ncbi:unnamed protein product [Brassica oleracea var. botrytis]